jgi:hypothetical protein
VPHAAQIVRANAPVQPLPVTPFAALLLIVKLVRNDRATGGHPTGIARHPVAVGGGLAAKVRSML